MLPKDSTSAALHIRKAQKYFGEIPMVSWLTGQVKLMAGDAHRAKSIFYALSEREKTTVFGAYGLLQLAVKEKSDNDILNAINVVLAAVPGAQDLISQAVAVSLRNRNYHMARKHLVSIEKGDKKKLMEAVICSEEGMIAGDMDMVARAFRLAPQLHRNAIYYAESLMKKKEYRKARKVLRKSFEKQQLSEIFDKYISCGNAVSTMDKIKSARKLVDEAPESWVCYYGIAQLALQEDMLLLAFENLRMAYEKAQYDFIADQLMKVAGRLDEPKPLSAINILSNPLKSSPTTFVWKCTGCGSEENEWVPVCNHCNRVGEHRQTTTTSDDKQLIISDNFENLRLS
jgi:uncharacterized membrane-anchored protein